MVEPLKSEVKRLLEQDSLPALQEAYTHLQVTN